MPHLLIPLLWGLGFQHINLGEYIDYNTITIWLFFVCPFFFFASLFHLLLFFMFYWFVVCVFTCFDFSPHFLLFYFYRCLPCGYCGAYQTSHSHNNLFHANSSFNHVENSTSLHPFMLIHKLVPYILSIKFSYF